MPIVTPPIVVPAGNVTLLPAAAVIAKLPDNEVIELTFNCPVGESSALRPNEVPLFVANKIFPGTLAPGTPSTENPIDAAALNALVPLPTPIIPPRASPF